MTQHTKSYQIHDDVGIRLGARDYCAAPAGGTSNFKLSIAIECMPSVLKTVVSLVLRRSPFVIGELRNIFTSCFVKGVLRTSEKVKQNIIFENCSVHS